ncbi:MAG: FAD-dependent monooxygenase [Candidatus Aenigmatarchaeota archaeon]
MNIKIVGAGPAGLITALYLNKAGYKPTIYEKQNREGYESTPCGEGISHEKLKKLKKDTGFNSKPNISNGVKKFRMIFPNKKSVEIKREIVFLDRTKWQKSMIEFLEDKGIEIQFNKEIGDLEDLNYTYLIGADGFNSRVRRKLDIGIDIHIASQYKMKLKENIEELKLYINEMFHYKDLGGYSWVFPKSDIVNVGVSNSFEVLDKFLDKYNIEGEILSKKASPVGINGKIFSNTDNNILLVGGAGGLTNSLTGGGLTPIIKSSKFIVDHIKDVRNYDTSIKASSINPQLWKNAASNFYTKNSIYAKMGNILNGEKFEFNEKYKKNISLSTKIKFLLNPGMWEYLDHNKKIFDKVFDTF